MSTGLSQGLKTGVVLSDKPWYLILSPKGRPVPFRS